MDSIEGHPIPQDITGFQFKLIGDMTVKQFAYLAGGLVLGWIIVVIPGPLFVKVPIAAVPTITGLIFAFLPIQGRPADTMFMLFMQSIFRPNEYIFHKPKNVIQQDLAYIKNGQKNPLPGQQYGPHITKVTSIEEIGSTTPQEKNTEHLTPGQAQKQEQQVSQTVNQLETELTTVKKQEEVVEATKQDNDLHKRALLLEEKLQQAILEKEALQKQLTSYQQAQIPQTQQAPQPVIQAGVARVKRAPVSTKQSVGMPFAPDVPNVVTGVVKDPRGNVLPGVLVEIKDKDDNPVRAFKTNALGQFASATPLLNGTYTMLFEDPKKEQLFDELELTINGTILTPMEVISIDEREELRKSLFTK